MSEMNQELKPRGRGCGLGCLIFLVVFLGLGFIMLLGFVSLVMDGARGGKMPRFLPRLQGTDDMGEDEMPFMVEKWSSGKDDGVKVVRIPVEGLISLGENNRWAGGNANTVLRSIRRATHDKEVKGLILEIDSGGGGITDSDIIYHALLKFKEADKNRVIVSLFGDLAASGAYYIALASDHILAHPTTLTGSIGVIMQKYEVTELAQKLGIQKETIKSGANKDLLDPFRNMSDEQREMLQGINSAMYERFASLVAKHRNLPVDVVKPLADGRVFVAEEAWKHKLIDGIGYAEDAQKTIAKLLNAEEDGVQVYRYGEQVTFMDLLSRPGIGFQSELTRLLQSELNGPRLMYKFQW